jgi:hypothetical protein
MVFEVKYLGCYYVQCRQFNGISLCHGVQLEVGVELLHPSSCRSSTPTWENSSSFGVGLSSNTWHASGFMVVGEN